ncbi:MAG: redoxin domain-containing protein [Fusobacteriota bacterium]
MVNIGGKISNFKLYDHEENEVEITKFDGKKVLLSFHPLAWTSVCAKQMKSLEDNYEKIKNLNTVPLGMSVDPIPSKAAWRDALEIQNIPFISDFWPHGKLAKELGIFSESQGFSKRVNIILDEEGKVIFVKKYQISELPDINEIINFLEDNK